ncbi:MAG TPA: HEAT repeat domain-containing protein [Allocoleopsis sp.]
MWANWDEFLEKIADVHGLDQEEREAFLDMFSEKGKIRSMKQLSVKLNISESAIKTRMGKVYGKFTQTCPGINGDSRGKAKGLQVWLNQQYSAQPKIKSAEATSSSGIASPDWQKICRDMLESQKQSIRRQASEIVSEPFYVQLGLVERRHQPRRGNDFSVSPEQGSGFFQLDKEEIIATYEHNEFLERVIKQKQSKKSQGKRIAIIGEPGAGKTTLLESIAFSPKITGCPIWISLGSLGDKSLEEYLWQKWLKDVLKTSDVTQQQKELEELFKSGEVLLLLDGVDEMPAPSSVEALAKIREELTGWVADARVVLTCRVNVWDASVNALQSFDTYRTLEFSYGDGNKPDQVREFICQWFSKAEKPELGEPLREKLEEDRHQRIRDLVKNPLRLSLLCQSWYFHQGDLPKTKAVLYEQFTRAFYDWKQEQFPTTPTERKELNGALGLLAREAIDKEKSRFGIRESLAIDVMGEDLFNLACKLHWLVHIYNDAETGEHVYAFFHPTFQEYFAARAIPNWDYFLKHVPHNPVQGTYRIFEPQWKEVILLWLGRDDVPKQNKEDLIQTLVEFDDGCSEFYKYRGYFLTAEAITEFRNFNTCSFADEIVLQIVKWAIDDFSDEEKSQLNFLYPLRQEANVALYKTDRQRVIHFLTKLIRASKDNIIGLNIVHTLGRIALGNLDAIKALTDLLHTNVDNWWIRLAVAEALGKIDFGNQDAIQALTNMLNTSQAESGQWYCTSIREINPRIVARSLGEIDRVTAIAVLTHLLQTNDDEDTQLSAAEILGEIDPGNPNAIKALTNLLPVSDDEYIDLSVAEILGEIDPGNPNAIKKLTDLLQAIDDEDTHFSVAQILGEIDPGNPNTIKILTELLHNSQNKWVRLRAASQLGFTNSNHPEAIKVLTNLLQHTQEPDIRCLAAWNLGLINSGNLDALSALIELLHNSKDEYIRRHAVMSLGQIGVCNLRAIKALIQSISTERDVLACAYAAKSLIEILPVNWLRVVVENLKTCLSKSDYENKKNSYLVFWHCAKNMSYSDFYQAWNNHSYTGQALESQLIDIASQVQPTDKIYPIAIDTQTLKLETSTNTIAQKLCTKIYRKACYSDIPSVNDAAQLQQYIPRIQEQLQKQNLALILQGCEPTEQLIDFCYSLADRDLGIYIGLITNKPLEQPLKGFLPIQDNLLSAIQSWIDEIR